MIKLKIFFIIIIIYLIIFFCNKNKKFIKLLDMSFLNLNHIKKHYVKFKNLLKFNKEAAYKILDEVSYILEKYNIFFWLSEGTALGVFRDNDLIDHDDDVDISFRSEYYQIFKDKVIPELKNLGYYIKNVGNVYYVMNKNIILDIDILFKNDICVAKYFQPVELEPHIKDFYIKEFRGHKYNLPKESYYEHLYGKDYMIPFKKKSKFSIL